MEYRIDYDEANELFIITTEGDFHFSAFRDLAEELLTHPQWRPGTGCLFDYRATDFLSLSLEEIGEPAALHAARNDEIGRGRSAMVMKDLGNFGMGRMYQMLVEDQVDTQFLITTEVEQGRAWLKAEARE